MPEGHLGLSQRVRRSAAGKLKAAARAVYKQQAADAELAAFGFSADDYPEDVISVYPDNWPHVEVFIAMKRQWRIGGNGPIGLDSTSLLSCLKLLRRPKKTWPETLEAIQVMELEALNEMDKLKK